MSETLGSTSDTKWGKRGIWATIIIGIPIAFLLGKYFEKESIESQAKKILVEVIEIKKLIPESMNDDFKQFATETQLIQQPIKNLALIKIKIKNFGKVDIASADFVSHAAPEPIEVKIEGVIRLFKFPDNTYDKGYLPVLTLDDDPKDNSFSIDPIAYRVGTEKTILVRAICDYNANIKVQLSQSEIGVVAIQSKLEPPIEKKEPILQILLVLFFLALTLISFLFILWLGKFLKKTDHIDDKLNEMIRTVDKMENKITGAKLKKILLLIKVFEKVKGTYSITLPELGLFSQRFMQEHSQSRYSSFDDFCRAGNIDLNPNGTRLQKPNEIDTFVMANTDFPNWESMISTAFEEWIGTKTISSNAFIKLCALLRGIQDYSLLWELVDELVTYFEYDERSVAYREALLAAEEIKDIEKCKKYANLISIYDPKLPSIQKYL